MDVEQEARELGWVPQDEFKGDPEKWRPAEEFVERGKTLLPILRKNNEKLMGQIENLRGETGELKKALGEAVESLQALREYNETVATQAYERAVKDLKAQRREALKDGDTEKALAIEDALEQVEPPKLPKAEPKAPEPPKAPQPDPIYKQWEADNAALLDTTEKQAYAVAMGQYLRATTGLVGRPFLDKVAEMVEERFAQKPAVAKVEGGSREVRKSGKTYDALPADAKAACDRFADRLVGPNRAYKTIDEWRKSYAASYDWSE